MEDRYLNDEETYNRLMLEYKKYSSLFVAFDFDNTVFDYHKTGDTFPKLEELLIKCKRFNMKLILFTANEDEKLLEIIKYCKERGYEPDYVNESPMFPTRKPYYNILLDDRAGLKSSYDALSKLLLQIENMQSH
jgi:hypothetical protein